MSSPRFRRCIQRNVWQSIDFRRAGLLPITALAAAAAARFAVPFPDEVMVAVHSGAGTVAGHGGAVVRLVLQQAGEHIIRTKSGSGLYFDKLVSTSYVHIWVSLSEICGSTTLCVSIVLCSTTTLCGTVSAVH